MAAQTLLDTHEPIGRLRGKFHDYHGIRVTCTYHPAYLLRNPAAKKDVWEDMKAPDAQRWASSWTAVQRASSAFGAQKYALSCSRPAFVNKALNTASSMS